MGDLWPGLGQEVSRLLASAKMAGAVSVASASTTLAEAVTSVRGAGPRLAETPAEFARRLGRLIPAVAGGVSAIAAGYARSRFSSHPVGATDGDWKRARKALMLWVIASERDSGGGASMGMIFGALLAILVVGVILWVACAGRGVPTGGGQGTNPTINIERESPNSNLPSINIPRQIDVNVNQGGGGGEAPSGQ